MKCKNCEQTATAVYHNIYYCSVCMLKLLKKLDGNNIDRQRPLF